MFGTSWYQPKTINNFRHFDVQIFFLQCDKSNPNFIDDILLKKVAGYIFFSSFINVACYVKASVADEQATRYVTTNTNT